MDYEQRYKEALNEAKAIHEIIRKDLKPIIEQIFPELKESRKYMKATELMIGDYVKYQEHIYIIEEISAKGWVHLIHPETKVRINMTSDYIMHLLEPIPLTKEILEKNGWIYNNEGEKFFPQTWINDKLMLRVIDDYNYRVVVISDYDDEDTNDTPFIITYIHELQHILRVCNLNELADNLKLK